MSYGHIRDRINWGPFALVIFTLYQAAIWIAWVIPSQYYVGFDEGWHLEVSQHLYYSLVDYGVLGLFWKFLHAMPAKPPLVSLLPVPFYLLLGNYAWVAAAVNLAWLLLLNVYLFRLVRHFWGDGPGLIACVSLQTMPLFPGLSRMVMAEYGTAVLVVMFMYYLFTHPSSTRRAIILGIIMGVGLLEKVLFPTYILGPLICTIWAEIRNKEMENRQHAFALWFLSFGIASILAGPWYLINFRHLMGYTFQSTYGELAKVYRFGTTLKDINALWTYLLEFINIGVTAYQGILLACVLIGSIVLGHNSFQKVSGPIKVGMVLWFLFPFLMYLPSLYRNFKFMMPFFTPMSIALGVLLWRLLSLIHKKQWRWFALSLLLLWPNLGILYASFPLGRINEPYHLFTVGPLELLPQRGYLGFPRLGRWPYEEILQFVASDGACFRTNSGRNPSIGMVADMREFNRSTMRYIQKRGRFRVEVYWAPVGGSSDPKYSLENALKLASQQDYLVFRSVSPTEVDFTNRFNDQIRQQIETGNLHFSPVKAFQLPDGTEALVYRRIPVKDEDWNRRDGKN